MNKKIYNPGILLTCLAIAYILLKPEECAYHCSIAVKLCINSLIPSLFIFMILSRILAYYCALGTFNGKAVYLLSKLLNLPVQLIPVCIFGLFSGAPSGAFAITELYKKGLCTKNEAERACVLSNNCSAAFIIGFTANQTVSRGVAFLILIANILSTMTVYLLLFSSEKKEHHSPTYAAKDHGVFTDILETSISSAWACVISLCGYVIFFYTFSCIISQKAGGFLYSLPAFRENIGLIKAIICGLSEMTSGIMSTSLIEGNIQILLTSSICAFCGFSVIMQVKSITGKHGISSKPYILSRFLCALLCPIYTLILISFSPSSILVSNLSVLPASESPGKVLISLMLITFIAIIGWVGLSHLDKKYKNR